MLFFNAASNNGVLPSKWEFRSGLTRLSVNRISQYDQSEQSPGIVVDLAGFSLNTVSLISLNFISTQLYLETNRNFSLWIGGFFSFLIFFDH